MGIFRRELYEDIREVILSGYLKGNFMRILRKQLCEDT